MAVPAGTVQTFAMVGIREQLSDVITNIMPAETPVYSMAKKKKARSRTPEWQRAIDGDPNPNNAVVEGDDATNDAGVQPERLKNVMQLFDKTAQVSSTAQAVNAAGRADEMKFQLAMRGREMKRDIEARANGNFASVTGNATTAGNMAGVEAWLTSNVSRGTGGASGGYNTGTGLIAAATDALTANVRVVTETLFKDVIANAWNNGGEPELVLCGPKMKQKISSSFTGVAALQNNLQNARERNVTVQGAIDLYRSDFGVHRIMPTRLGCYGAGRTNRVYRPASAAEHEEQNRSILVLTPDTWSISFLQPIQQKPLAEDGHSTRRLMWTEATLECAEERANGIVADVKVA